MTILISCTPRTAKNILKSVYDKCKDATYQNDELVVGTVTADSTYHNGVLLKGPFNTPDGFSGYLPKPISSYSYEISPN